MDIEGNGLGPDQVDVPLRVLDNGPAEVDWLTQRLRSELRDTHFDEKRVTSAVESATVLVGRPDGRVSRLLDLLEGQTLTHRVTAGTVGRTDLWTNLSLQPLHACAVMAPIPLASGGEVRSAQFGHAALVGPPGWLPDVPAGSLLARRSGKGGSTSSRSLTASARSPSTSRRCEQRWPDTSERKHGGRTSVSRTGKASSTAPSGTPC